MKIIIDGLPEGEAHLQLLYGDAVFLAAMLSGRVKTNNRKPFRMTTMIDDKEFVINIEIERGLLDEEG